jgi:hypothetical protein
VPDVGVALHGEQPLVAVIIKFSSSFWYLVLPLTSKKVWYLDN